MNQTETRQKEARAKENGAQVPPSDYQAEQGVIGAVLVDDTAFTKVVDFVGESSFYWRKHGIIFEAMLALFHRNEPTDLVTVSAELKTREQLEDIGGDYYLAELQETVPFPRNVEYYARIVQEKYLLRQVAVLSEETATKAYDPSTEAKELLDWQIRELFNLQKHDERTGYRGLSDITHETLERIDEISQRQGALTGVGSGYLQLDELLGGFQDSDLIVIAARPSMGKTALALCFAHNAALIHRKPVGLISLEMDAKQIAMRLMSFQSRVPLKKIRTAKFSKDEWKRIAKASSDLSSLPVYIDDTPLQTITDVRARAKRLQMQYDVGLIILDYLQLIQPPAKVENQQQTIAMFSRQLKGLAKELSVPVIAVSQLSRAVETRGGSKRPILSDLRDSGAIEQDADVVMFVYRQAYYDMQDGKAPEETDNTAEVIIAKQRNGPTGKVELIFQKEFALFASKSMIHGDMEPPQDVGSDEAPF